MAHFKGTMIFNDCRQGWTESLYWTGSSRADAVTKFTNVAKKRWLLLGEPVVIEAIRVNDVEIDRDCGLFEFEPQPYSTGLLAGRPYDAWLYELMAGDEYCRSAWLRGIPDDWVIRSDDLKCNFFAQDAMKTNFAAYEASLIANAMQLRDIRKVGSGIAPIAITGLAEATDGYTIALVAGLPDSGYHKVRFKDWQGPDRKILNGVHRIVALTGISVKVDILWADLTGPLLNFDGKAVAQWLDYNTITGAELRYAGKKSTGRAFFVLAGRRRARR